MMDNSSVFVLLLLAKFSVLCCTTASPIFVEADENDSQCQNRTPCHTLSHYATNSSQYFNSSDAELVFLLGLHYLDRNVSFENLENICLTVDVMTGVVGTEIICVQSVGFSFQNITNLSMNGLTFTGCGMIHLPETNPHFSSLSACLYMKVIVNLSLTEITVQNSTGYGLFLSQIYGSSKIQNCTFQLNSGFNDSLDGGNAVLMYQAQEKKINRNVPASVTIERSRFLLGKSFKFASGLLLIVLCSGVRVHIVETEIRENQAEFSNDSYCMVQPSSGGNLALLFHDYDSPHSKCTPVSNKTEITIHKSNITLGKACLGGGMFAKFTSSNKTEKGGAVNVSLSDAILNSNMAITSGGAVFMQLNSQVSYKDESFLSLSRCSLINNQILANNMAGIAVTVTSLAIGTHHLSPLLVFSECQFFNNHLRMTEEKANDTRLFASVLFVSQCMDGIQLHNGTEFADNRVTAISLLQSSLTFSGCVTLSNNIGYTGGGIALHEVSYLILTTNTTLTILYNQARFEGGGIFVDDEPVMLQNEPCFYQIQGTDTQEAVQNVRIVLINNTAPYGSQIYGGRIKSCTVEYTGQNNFSDIFELENIDNNDSSIITSEPEEVHFCHNGTLDLDNTVTSVPHSVFSGESFNVSIAFTGQYGGITHGKAKFSIRSTQSKVYEEALTDVLEKCKVYKVTVFTREESELLDIQAVAMHYHLSFKKHVEEISLNVDITATPLGFVSTGKKSQPYECIEDPKLTDFHFECTINKNEGMIKRWPPYWLGYENSSNEIWFVLYSYCPIDYCLHNYTNLHADSEEIALDDQCADHRVGVLCGQCKHGYSLSLGTSACLNCSHISIADSIGISLGFASVGVVLILIFYCFNLLVTQGTLSGFQFYMNVVYVYWAPLQPNSNGGFSTFFRFFISGANLVFGCNCCLYNGMDMIGRTWVQFMLVIYLWILVGGVILASRYLKWVNKWVGNNTVPVLALIIYMSQTSLSLAIIHSLSWADLIYRGQTSNATFQHKVLLYSGHFHFFDKNHIPLFMVACILGTLGLCFTLMLLCIQPLQKYSNFVLLKWVNKFKPFIDAYTHPHIIKTKYRFWTGFLLLARSVIYVVYVTNIGHDNKKSLHALSLITFIVFLTQLCLGGVYTKKHLNATFSFYILNLFLLSVILSSMYPCKSAYIQPPNNDISDVSHIFMSLAILVFLGTLGHHGYHHVKKTKVFNFMKCAFFKRNNHGYQAMESCVGEPNRDAISTSSSLGTPRNIHPPLSITYREPQLRDYDSI